MLMYLNGIYTKKVHICLFSHSSELTTVFVPRAKNQNPTHMKWESVQLVPPLSKLSRKIVQFYYVVM